MTLRMMKGGLITAMLMGLAVPALAQAPATDGPLPDTAKMLRAALPHDLSPWNMFLTADSVVKGVS